MIFSRYYTIFSKKNREVIEGELLGQHVNIHNIDFEIVSYSNIIKIVPHAEHDNNVRTLPVVRLKVEDYKDGSRIRLLAKPRRIDVGGPMLVFVILILIMVSGIVVKISSNDYNILVYGLFGMFVLGFLTFWYRLEIGYFEYVRKIRNFIKQIA